MTPLPWPDPRAAASDGQEPALDLAEAKRVLLRFWAFVRPYRAKFFLGIFLLLLAVPLAQFALFLTRDVTNKALLASSLTSEERWATVVRIVSLQALFWLVGNLLSTWREVIEWYNSMRVTFDIRHKFYKHLHRLPMATLSRRSPGQHLFRATADMVSMFRIGNRPATATASGQSPPESKEVVFAAYSNDVDPYDPGIAGLITRTVPLLIETVYALGWGTALLFLIDPVLSLGLVLYIVPFALISHVMFNRIRKTAFSVKQRSEFEMGVLRDSIAGLRTFKVFGRLAHQRRNYFRAASGSKRRSVQQAFEMAGAQNVVQSGMKWAFSMTLYLYVAIRVVNGQASVGDWVATFLLVEAAQAPLENFVQLVQLTKMQLIPAQRVLQTLDEEPSLEDRPNPVKLNELQGHLDFKNVSFSYQTGRPALQGLNLTINPGEYVGIVGPSGAGKSSLVALLLRLYAPDEGEIKVDGVNVLDLEIAEFLSKTATVSQETPLYSGTIAENILFGNPWASIEDVDNAAGQAGVTQFVARWADGLDTEVSENGFSGGERQRIGIARALVRNPRLLILDEATASLDSLNEETILSLIGELRKDRTVLSIAHRLKAVMHCDKIFVLQEGRVVAQGTHDELLSQGGLYRELWVRQEGDPSKVKA